MWSLLQRLSALAALCVGVQATLGPKTDLVIGNQIVAPDGYSRVAVSVNGEFPAPVIKATKGESFRLNVVNNLTDPSVLNSTSIHWHGLFPYRQGWSDGAAFVTQCPILPGNSFLFNFSVPTQSGTFWYHSHISTQYCDGLRGPLIIYDPEDPHRHLYDVDDESTIITLADYYHYPLPLKGGNVPITLDANSTLINGRGRYVNDTTGDLTVVTVERGKRYRFRLLSMSCDPAWNFGIDNHTFTIIEADGHNTEPLEIDSLQIYAGQRYSFVLEANQPIGNYWIRANPNGTAIAGFTGGINSAILRYVGAKDEDPAPAEPPVSENPMYEFNLHALESPEAPGGPGLDNVFPLNLNLGFDDATGMFTIDNVSFASPTVPVLLQILSGTHNAQELMPAGSVIGLPGNTVVELSIPGFAVGGKHPFHLHGHNFSVIRNEGVSTYNYKNPVRRDTVNIGALGENVTLRFDTSNPGPWFVHCHVDSHFMSGLAIIFAEDIPQTELDPVPTAWNQLCPLWDADPYAQA